MLRELSDQLNRIDDQNKILKARWEIKKNMNRKERKINKIEFKGHYLCFFAW